MAAVALDQADKSETSHSFAFRFALSSSLMNPLRRCAHCCRSTSLTTSGRHDTEAEAVLWAAA
jgi:hypothetical protein